MWLRRRDVTPLTRALSYQGRGGTLSVWAFGERGFAPQLLPFATMWLAAAGNRRFEIRKQTVLTSAIRWRVSGIVDERKSLQIDRPIRVVDEGVGAFVCRTFSVLTINEEVF